jgi:ribonucleoside-triphosphate reductase (formate)
MGDIVKEIDEYVNKSSWRTRSNANWNYSFSGLQSSIAGRSLAIDAIEKFGKYGKKHKDGFYHLHNLEGGVYGRYCSGNDLMKLLQDGLHNPAGISAKPAKHLNTAIDHIINMTYIMTGEWQGAQAWSHIDILLAPYIRKDKLSFGEVRQEMQRLIWSFSFPMRPNFQSPFTNLTFGLRPNKYFENLVPFVGEEYYKDTTYADYQREINMINKAFLDIMIEGPGDGPFTFPLPTYNITKDFKWRNMNNPESVEYKIFELAAKWGTPYFSNYVSSDISEEDMLSMCCRLRIDTSEVQRASGGIWSFGNNTGSLAVFTINMSRLGYLSNGNEKRFYRLLDRQLEDGKNYLLMKKRYVKDGKDLGLFPMTNYYVGDKILKTYFLTIGINGLNECSMNFAELNILQNDVWCNDVLKYIRAKVLEMQISSGELFNFEATPAEGCSYGLAKTDREKFDDIFTQGNVDAPYYTGNSMIPMNMDVCAETALKHQSILQQNYTGGSIFHIDEGTEYSPNAVANYIRRTCRDYTLPYVTWSPTYSLCKDHGKGFGKEICCDKGNNYTRVVGYYRPVNRLNIGKKQEFDEKKFLRKE